MTQPTLPFKPPNFIKGTKYLVYADITYVREYYEPDEGVGFFTPTKKQYRNETVLIGVVDNETDIEHVIDKLPQRSKFDWSIEKKHIYAKSITYFYEGE